MNLKEQYKELMAAMDELGFSEYQDGAGDFGERRFRRTVGKDILLFNVFVMDMEEDYYGDTPENQFYGIIDSCNQVPIDTREELEQFINEDDNFYRKFRQPIDVFKKPE